MGLFNKKNEELYGDYPTKEEFFKEAEKIQSEELTDDRYILAYEFLTNNYWNRENKNLEEELFKIIGTYGLEETMFDKTSEYRKSVRMKKYEILKQFIGSLSKEQINSNIFLKSTYLFMNMSNEVCSIIMDELYSKINSENVSSSLTLELEIPEETQKLIPNYISTKRGIKYYRPEAYKIEYIDVLDLTHKYVYEDYNLLVEKIGKLAEDVYFLQLNEMISNTSEFECNYFQVYHPGYNNHFIASFLIKAKQNNQTSQELEDKNKSMTEKIKRIMLTNPILNIFTKEYKTETEYIEFMKQHIDDFKLLPDSETEDEIMERLINMSKIESSINYNLLLSQRRNMLKKELDRTNSELELQQEACDHIKVCIGFDGSFPCRDTSINKCLLCGKDEPVSKYPLIEACDYKNEIYSHGELSYYRENRFIELQNLVINILSRKPDLSMENLVEIIKDIINNPVSSKYQDLSTCYDNPEMVDEISKEEQGLVIKLAPNEK